MGYDPEDCCSELFLYELKSTVSSIFIRRIQSFVFNRSTLTMLLADVHVFS